MRLPILAPALAWWLPAAALLSAVGLVAAVRAYALRAGILDVPNGRSSHVAPTPRGGGIGFMLPILACLALSPLAGWPLAAAVVAAGAVGAVTGIGWLDDRRSVGVRARLAVHVLAGGLIAALALSLGAPLAGALAAALVVVWVVWTVALVNVVNFMDGTDALIGVQAVVFAGHVAVLSGAASPAGELALVVLAAVVGFLLFNWPPASIFMGDSGSGGLGVVFALLAVLALRDPEIGFVQAFLPLAPLFGDEAITMIRRVRNGESLVTAHRGHVYQLLARAGWSHARIALLYGSLSAALAFWANASAGGVFRLGAAGAAAILLTFLLSLRLHADRAAAARS